MLHTCIIQCWYCEPIACCTSAAFLPLEAHLAFGLVLLPVKAKPGPVCHLAEAQSPTPKVMYQIAGLTSTCMSGHKRPHLIVPDVEAVVNHYRRAHRRSCILTYNAGNHISRQIQLIQKQTGTLKFVSSSTQLWSIHLTARVFFHLQQALPHQEQTPVPRSAQLKSEFERH